MPKESWAGDQEQESYKAWLKAREKGREGTEAEGERMKLEGDNPKAKHVLFD